MSDKLAFAALLAQVIPVAILAVVLEAKSGHETRVRLAERTQAPVQVDPTVGWTLVKELGILVILVFLEVAALLTAADQAGPFIAWFAGPPGAIGTGLLLVVVGQLYIENLTWAYDGVTMRPAGQTLRTVANSVMWTAVGCGALAILLLWMPWSPW
ncbi:hypothetical protein OG357_38155 (plasmid) [Streptomyces sp. NBC_01255]|uniref:hypothetical protein n=1 Tax=Streptomyces sp. NBC_01255 TaxID=2903798 RepID=UPI002E2FA63A|nr:hypothetical protein [Streptomyces sp. NBC_01255]